MLAGNNEKRQRVFEIRSVNSGRLIEAEHRSMPGEFLYSPMIITDR
jgi:hypothetical protein